MITLNITIHVAGHTVTDAWQGVDVPDIVRTLNECGIQDGEYDLPPSVVDEAVTRVRESNQLTHGG